MEVTDLTECLLAARRAFPETWTRLIPRALRSGTYYPWFTGDLEAQRRQVTFRGHSAVNRAGCRAADSIASY